jgi:hypothetical protein
MEELTYSWGFVCMVSYEFVHQLCTEQEIIVET